MKQIENCKRNPLHPPPLFHELTFIREFTFSISIISRTLIMLYRLLPYIVMTKWKITRIGYIYLGYDNMLIPRYIATLALMPISAFNKNLTIHVFIEGAL